MAVKEDRVATSVRLPQQLYRQLKLVADQTRVPINSLIERALDRFLPRELDTIERNARDLADRIAALRVDDPDYEKAISRRANAEGAMEYDPAQGRLVPAGKASSGAAPAVEREDIFGHDLP